MVRCYRCAAHAAYALSHFYGSSERALCWPCHQAAVAAAVRHAKLEIAETRVRTIATSNEDALILRRAGLLKAA